MHRRQTAARDHPHIYLNMGDASDIVCPYYSTLFRFDPTLGAREADPARIVLTVTSTESKKQQHSFSPCCCSDHRQTPLSGVSAAMAS